VICATINPDKGNHHVWMIILRVKDLSRLRIEPQSPNPLPVVIAMSFDG